MARIRPHLPFGIHGRLIEAQRTLWIHNTIGRPVPDQHRALDLLCNAFHCIVGEFSPGIGKVFRADYPSYPVLYRRIVFQQIAEHVMRSGGCPDGLDPAVSAGRSRRRIAAHADPTKTDAVGVDIWSCLEIIDQIRHKPFRIRRHVQMLDSLRGALSGQVDNQYRHASGGV